MISKYPCYGVQHIFEGTQDTLVAWCLTYDYGAIGMLFTLEVECEYRTFVVAVSSYATNSIGTSTEGSVESCCATTAARQLLQIPGLRLH